MSLSCIAVSIRPVSFRRRQTGPQWHPASKVAGPLQSLKKECKGTSTAIVGRFAVRFSLHSVQCLLPGLWQLPQCMICALKHIAGSTRHMSHLNSMVPYPSSTPATHSWMIQLVA